MKGSFMDGFRLASVSTRWALGLACAASLALGACSSAGDGTSPDAAGGGGSAAGGSPGDGGHAVSSSGGAGGVLGLGGILGSGGAGAGSGSGGMVTAGTGGRSGVGGAGGTASGGAPGAGGRAGSAGGLGGRAGALRIMPLGDSTTGSVCWRAVLWQMLNQAGFTGRYDFVGSRHNDPGCNVTGYDQDNEGHPSVLITNFINDADDQVANVQTPQALLAQNPADVVLFHFATNDVWNSVDPTAILAAYTTVLGALRAANPNVIVLVAQLIPLVPINVPITCPACACPTACDQRMVTLNGMIPAWATAHSTATSPIRVVDQHTGFVSTTDTVDGVHPNAAGSAKIAAKWFAALTSLF
jgi:lysophospholipase L1-like esterase